MSTSHTRTPWRIAPDVINKQNPLGVIVAFNDYGQPVRIAAVNLDYSHLTREEQEANQHFILRACNDHAELHSVISAQRQDLDSAHSNWELAVEAGNDVVQQLEAAKLVQQQLVAALREANDLLALVAIDLDDEADYGNSRANEIVGRIRAALAAAGAA